MTRRLCHHCGLPMFASETENAPVFCCYGCYLAWRIVGEQGQAGAPASLLARLGVAGVLAMNVMMLSILLYAGALGDVGRQTEQLFRWGLLALSTPVLIILGAPYLIGALGELCRGRPSVDSLIAVGSFAGYGVSAAHVIQGRGPIYFDTATMLLVLVTLGKLLEASAKVEAARQVRALLDLTPPVARRVGGESEEVVPVAELRVGDSLRVRPGERVPADGMIQAGVSGVQEALLTGEFLPRSVSPGERVLGGSVNGEAELLVSVTALGEDSVIAQIARLVAQAQAARAPLERMAARVAMVFVPVVIALSLGALVFWAARGEVVRGGLSALAVLVVACPCALGLATPLAIIVALARAAREGVLIRSGEALETLGRVTHVFFDKTGTLTQGEPALRELLPLDPDLTADAALSWAATLESSSEHVLARAVTAAARAQSLPLGTVRAFRAFPGQGAAGLVSLNGSAQEVWAGTEAWLGSRSFDLSGVSDLPAPEPSDAMLFVAWDGKLRARLAVADVVRPEAPEAVAQLQHAGLTLTVLSGDRREAAEQLARELGAPNVLAERTPEAKLAAVRAAKQRGGVVAVVGDGINDAPALAEADVGLAMGGGTDLTRETGDIVLLGHGLQRLPWLFALARRTRHTIRLNLGWAFGYNLVALGLAFSGHLPPLAAALIMLGSSLFVIHNSLRLARR